MERFKQFLRLAEWRAKQHDFDHENTASLGLCDVINPQTLGIIAEWRIESCTSIQLWIKSCKTHLEPLLFDSQNQNIECADWCTHAHFSDLRHQKRRKQTVLDDLQPWMLDFGRAQADDWRETNQRLVLRKPQAASLVLLHRDPFLRCHAQGYWIRYWRTAVIERRGLVPCAAVPL